MGWGYYLRKIFASPADPGTAALYRACVAAARRPVFYAERGVPDSVDGRFDLLLLHVFLAMRRLPDRNSKQRLFDFMYADMDRSLREMGVGDMGIGKKMKPMLTAFYGRGEAYEKALAESGDAALAAALERNVYGSSAAGAEQAPKLAAYVRAAIAALAVQNEGDINQGRIDFPNP